MDFPPIQRVQSSQFLAFNSRKRLHKSMNRNGLGVNIHCCAAWSYWREKMQRRPGIRRNSDHFRHHLDGAA
ncbi:MAG TPA: hypothetical protein VLA28_12525, partial [Afifellaceae bacterium]|nr:hypothetical protein [Afifellaceae bacterium]